MTLFIELVEIMLSSEISAMGHLQQLEAESIHMLREVVDPVANATVPAGMIMDALKSEAARTSAEKFLWLLKQVALLFDGFRTRFEFQALKAGRYSTRGHVVDDSEALNLLHMLGRWGISQTK